MWQNQPMATRGDQTQPTRTDRHGARQAAIIEVARRQLGEVGPAALSLRAIARELDLVPSAVYRYFAGRDAILTTLVVDGFNRLGQAVEDGAASTPAPRECWIAAWRAARTWAVDNPHEYALLYGTPVLGYAAPDDTVIPAQRIVMQLARIVLEAGAVPEPTGRTLDRQLADDVREILAVLPSLGFAEPIAPDQVVAVIDAWCHLIGTISFELFGQFTGAIEHGEKMIIRLAEDWADRVGLRD